ncbi:MAG TPA: hypothetical protein VLB44_11850 [Kofleriaceae bacterium]|nr:hypothetical protein [Kofleriaceae bacterium]
MRRPAAVLTLAIASSALAAAAASPTSPASATPPTRPTTPTTPAPTAPATSATPAPSPPPSWADWVGDWDGKLKWSSCAIQGEEHATLALDAIDGGVTFDLSPAGGSLPKLSLVEDNTGWVAQQGDVKVRVERTPKELALTVDLDSGCQVRGTLARPGVGIAACDELAAWARIESHCTKLARPPLENPARLARQRAEWTKARGDARTKLSAQCTARSARVEAQLVDVGCAPNPDPNIGMRGAECQALRAASARLQRCPSVPFDMRTALDREVVVLLAAAQGADQASLPVVDAECKRSREKVFAITQQAGCPP